MMDKNEETRKPSIIDNIEFSKYDYRIVGIKLQLNRVNMDIVRIEIEIQ